MRRRPSGHKLRLKRANLGGRPNVISDPMRPFKDSLGIVLAALKEEKFLPDEINAGRLANLIAAEGTESLIELEDQYLSVTYLPTANVSVEKLRNQSHYLSQVYNDTSAARAGYSAEAAKFVRASSEIILLMLTAQSQIFVPLLARILCANFEWPDAIVSRIAEFSMFLHSSDPAFFGPPSPEKAAIFDKILREEALRIESLSSSLDERH